jgi:hypothetical protein
MTFFQKLIRITTHLSPEEAQGKSSIVECIALLSEVQYDDDDDDVFDVAG